MKKFKLKPVVLALGLSVFSQMATAVIFSDRAVVKNDGSQRVAAKVKFATPVSGDLYIATKVGGQFLFLTNGGNNFTPDVVPLASNNEYVGEYPLFDFSAAGITPGLYPLYQVVTQAGTSPLNFNNWVGGLGSLSSFQYSIGLAQSVTKDFNNDGFPDDDLNHDGFSDQGTAPTPTPSTANGKSLYSANCSSCHGATPRYNKIFRAVDPARSRYAINNNKGGMSYLSFLTDTELQAIADYVKNPQ